MFAFFLTIFFENPSESHPLAKNDVTAFSPKEVKSSDLDQSGTIQMMKHKQPQKKWRTGSIMESKSGRASQEQRSMHQSWRII